MNMKRFVCGAMAAALLALPALALEEGPLAVEIPLGTESPAAAQDPAFALSQWKQLYPIHYAGVAAGLEENRLSLKDSLEDPGLGKIILHLSEQTRILDAATGEPRTFADLKEGEELSVWTSPVMALSMPPQSTAQVILCNIPEDGFAPIYAEIQQVNRGEDGSLSALTTDDVVLHLGQETELFAYRSKNIVALEDLRPGDRILAWYSMVMESYPAQAVPGKVMVFPYEYEGWISVEADGSFAVDGQESATAGKVEEESLSLPLRAVAEALGCEVRWNAETPDQVKVLKDGQELYAVTLGSATLVAEGDMVYEMGAPAQAQEGITYLSADDLIRHHNLKLEGRWPQA